METYADREQLLQHFGGDSKIVIIAPVHAAQ